MTWLRVTMGDNREMRSEQTGSAEAENGVSGSVSIRLCGQVTVNHVGGCNVLNIAFYL